MNVRSSAPTLASLVGAGTGEQQKRIARAQKDFEYFCTQYLSHLFFKDFAPYQKEILRMVTDRALSKEGARILCASMPDTSCVRETQNIRGIVNIEPRGHGKTVRMCLALPLWRALTKQSTFIVIIAANQTAAGRLSSDIAWEIASNERIKEDWGELIGSTWSTNELRLTNGVCMRFAGAGTAIRGVRYRQHRPDLILIDDLMTDGSAASATQREKQFCWFKRAVIPMAKDALIVTTGTVMHNDDVVSRLCREIANGAMPHWLTLRFQSLRAHPRRKGVMLALWPEHWDLAALQRKKQEIGSHNFATEYQNEPLAPEDALIKIEWLRQFTSSAFDINAVKVFAGVDPSAGKHDESAIVVVGLLSDKRVVVLDAWARCCTPSVLVSRCIAMHAKWRPLRIAFEVVGFQGVYKKYIEERGRAHGVRLPIVEATPKGMSKHSRVERMSPYFENGTYFFTANSACDALIDELTLFPKHQYDDMVDALYYAIEVALGRGRAAPRVFACGETRHSARLMRGL